MKTHIIMTKRVKNGKAAEFRLSKKRRMRTKLRRREGRTGENIGFTPKKERG